MLNEESVEELDFIKNEGKIISNYFNVYSILKLWFKKKSDDYVGRFHPVHAINSTNPLTNTKIVGEVEFYKVENPYLEIEPKESRYP